MSSYYESQRRRRQPRKRYITGEGLFDSFKKIITSDTVKDIAKDIAKDLARKGLNEAGKKGTEMLVNKIIPPKKGRGLSDKSKEILSRRTVPIEKYVKRNAW